MLALQYLSRVCVRFPRNVIVFFCLEETGVLVADSRIQQLSAINLRDGVESGMGCLKRVRFRRGSYVLASRGVQDLGGNGELNPGKQKGGRAGAIPRVKCWHLRGSDSDNGGRGWATTSRLRGGGASLVVQERKLRHSKPRRPGKDRDRANLRVAYVVDLWGPH